jgi:DNA-binding NtrC family response regulator
MTKRILLVDDDPTIRESLAEALADGATEVRTAETAERALALLADGSADVVVSDVRMPGLDGVALLRLVRERAPSVDVVLMTAYDDMPTVVSAMRDGAAEFLVKPLDLHELRRVLARVFEDRRTRERVGRAAEEGAAYRLDQLVGRDPRMIEIYKLIGQVAGSRATVLIRGESGTGKELIARAVHSRDPGRERVTGRRADHGAFKTPTLRDAARTAPYMHDGSIATLEDVIEFYDRGGKASPNLDPEIRPLRLSARDKQDLLAFLHVLSGEHRP